MPMCSFARRSLFTLALMVPFTMASATETGPAIAGNATPSPAATAMTPDQAREEYAYALGVQAYIYGYPSIEMYRVRNHAIYDPASKTQATINQFHHRRELVVPNATTVVAPNNDTLYS